jgi:hypothetical protein
MKGSQLVYEADSCDTMYGWISFEMFFIINSEVR